MAYMPPLKQIAVRYMAKYSKGNKLAEDEDVQCGLNDAGEVSQADAGGYLLCPLR